MKQYDLEYLVCDEWEIITGGILMKTKDKYLFIAFSDREVESQIKDILIPLYKLCPGADK